MAGERLRNAIRSDMTMKSTTTHTAQMRSSSSHAEPAHNREWKHREKHRCTARDCLSLFVSMLPSHHPIPLDWSLAICTSGHNATCEGSHMWKTRAAESEKRMSKAQKKRELVGEAPNVKASPSFCGLFLDGFSFFLFRCADLFPPSPEKTTNCTADGIANKERAGESL